MFLLQRVILYLSNNSSLTMKEKYHNILCFSISTYLYIQISQKFITVCAFTMLQCDTLQRYCVVKG